MSIEQQFNAAVKVIQSLPKDGFFQPSNEMRLRFYAFFKQATEGPNETKRPAFYDIINRYKWDAWTKCGQMTKDEAMKLYVDELKKVIETISMTHEVSEFLDLLGPFYEFLPNEIKNDNNADVNNENVNDENKITTTKSNEFTTYDSDGDEFADTIDTQLIEPQQQMPKIFDENSSSVINNNPLLGFNEQLAVAIFQLQNSLNRITSRIDNLEKQQQQEQNKKSDKNWPLTELRSQTTIFLLTWPMIVFFVFNYIQRLRKK